MDEQIVPDHVIQNTPGELDNPADRLSEAMTKLGLACRPAEMLTYDEISEVAAHGGFPVRYPHWRWGMEYEELARNHGSRERKLDPIKDPIINDKPVYVFCLSDGHHCLKAGDYFNVTEKDADSHKFRLGRVREAKDGRYRLEYADDPGMVYSMLWSDFDHRFNGEWEGKVLIEHQAELQKKFEAERPLITHKDMDGVIELWKAEHSVPALLREEPAKKQDGFQVGDIFEFDWPDKTIPKEPRCQAKIVQVVTPRRMYAVRTAFLGIQPVSHKGLCKILYHHNGQLIAGPSKETGYWPLPAPKPLPFSRRGLLKRDKGHCRFCGQQLNDRLYSGGPDAEGLFVHLVSRTNGGQTSWENCVMCCSACHRKKAGRTPEEAGMKVIPLDDPNFAREFACNVHVNCVGIFGLEEPEPPQDCDLDEYDPMFRAGMVIESAGKRFKIMEVNFVTMEYLIAVPDTTLLKDGLFRMCYRNKCREWDESCKRNGFLRIDGDGADEPILVKNEVRIE